MAFPTYDYQNTLATQRFANALYNIQVGSTTLDAVLGDINNSEFGRADDAFNNYYAYSFGSMTPAQVTETLLANFGIVAGQYGLTEELVGAVRLYITGQLAAAPANARGAVVADLTEAWAGLAGDATFGAAATAWNAEIDAAMAYEGEADVVAGTVIPDNTFFRLTAQDDIIAGTSGDDTFFANVVQVDGRQVNALGDGDELSGLGGLDTLDARVTQGIFGGSVAGVGNMPITPTTFGIENVKLEADFSGAVGNVAQLYIDDTIVNAEHMANVDFIGSEDSDADLVITNLTVDEGELTSSMTIGMAYSGNADHRWDASDLEVYFDEDDLLAGQDVTDSDAFWWLLDEDGHDATFNKPGVTYEPLQSINISGVFFDLDGESYTISIGEFATGLDYHTAKTWEAYTAMLQDELEAMQASGTFGTALDGLSFTLDYSNNDETNTDTQHVFVIPAITLIDANGGTFANQGFFQDQTAIGEFDVYGRFNLNASEDVDLLISVDVELEKVGRGGDGGELIIGGMNKDSDNQWGDGSTLKPAGVQQFDVTVLGGALLPNSLAALESTNNALQVVNIVSEAGVVLGDAADLIIGNTNTTGALGTLAGNAEALKDVQTINAAGFLGDLTVYAALTDEIGPKYLNLVDLQNDPAEDNIQFTYTLGQGNDFLNLVISDSNLLALGTTTREDFQLTINGGTGADTIQTLIGTGEGDDATAWYQNSHLNNTNAIANDGNPKGYLVINADAGDDTVWTQGAGDFVINAGSGNDVVFIDNFSANSAGISKAQWALNFTTFPTLSDVNNNNNPVLVDGTDVNLTYDLTVTVTFNDLVATATLTLPAAGTAAPTVSDLVLNQLVKQAINDDVVLSELLLASDGPANTLVIDALINGDQSVDNGIAQPAAAPSATQTVGELTVAFTTEGPAAWAPTSYLLQQTQNGINDAASTDNVINLGSDNDLLVLTSANNGAVVVTSTDTAVPTSTVAGGAATDCNDTIVYDAVNFGNDTILNFVANSNLIVTTGTVSATALPTPAVGQDKFDFTVLGGVAAQFGAAIQTNGAINVVQETAANDTTTEIATIFGAGDVNASKHIYITYEATNLGNVYQIVDGAAATGDVTVTLIGTIDLADTAWSSLGTLNFV
jgi:hypothetical protein